MKLWGWWKQEEAADSQVIVEAAPVIEEPEVLIEQPKGKKMATLNESIQAKIAEFEAKLEAVKTTAAAEVAALEAEIAGAKTSLSGLVPWLEQEVTAAETAISAFFAKIKG